MAKGIQKSSWNLRHQCEENHPKGHPNTTIKSFKRRRDSFCKGPGDVLGTGLIRSCISLSAVTRRLKCGRRSSIGIGATTPNVTIQHIIAINGRTGICLKLKRVCDRV
jgi:hypothetical protein